MVRKNLSAIQDLWDDQNIFKKHYSELKFTQNVVNKPCIFHWKFQPNFCENNECQRMFEGSVWPIGEWTCNNLIRELLCLSFLSSSHLLSSPATCYLQIRTRWVSQFGSPLKRVMAAVLDKNRADFFFSSYKHKIEYAAQIMEGIQKKWLIRLLPQRKHLNVIFLFCPKRNFCEQYLFPEWREKLCFFFYVHLLG